MNSGVKTSSIFFSVRLYYHNSYDLKLTFTIVFNKH